MNKKLIKGVFATALLACSMGALSACPPHQQDQPPVIIDEEYVILVSAPSAVKASLDKEKAKKGETVTLKIDSISSGVSIKDVTMNSSPLSSTDGGSTYTFVMPEQSVKIVITVKVEGDVVIEGDIAAKLEEIGSTGVYVARNIKASGASASSKFSWAIKGADGKQTKCDVLDLDETKSFADIRMVNGKKDDEKFFISNGYTYDFYYDENNTISPCYVQRVGVDEKPTSVGTLQSLLITSPTVRSEYSVYADNFMGAHYEVRDNSSEDVIDQVYDWNLYENNISYATISDKSSLDDDATMFVYKEYDESTQTYITADTYAKYSGKKLVNDDRYRCEKTGNQAIALKANVIKDSDEDFRYTQIPERHAIRNVRTSSHMPAFFVEREIMDAYRIGFSTEDGMTAWNINIDSADKEDGNFDVTLVSFSEYDSTKNSSGSFTTVVQKAYKYTVNMSFNKCGALTSLDYKRVIFNADQWDFVSHEAKQNVKGKTEKIVKATYEYGQVKSGKPNLGDVNLEDYFVSEIIDVQLWDTRIDDKASKDAGKSKIAINDTIALYDPFAGDYSAVCANKNFFAPATALDYWQYAPIASSNEEVIQKLASDSVYEMSAVNEGTTTLTIGSMVGNGPTLDVDVEVVATSLARNFWINGNVTPDYVTSSTSADVKAGGKYKFYIEVSPSDAALKYHPVSSNSNLLKVTSKDNARYLEIDTTGALNLTENTTVKVTMEANYGMMSQTSQYKPTELEFTILPADINPAGTWRAVDTNAYPNTYITFSTEAYTGTVAPGFTGALKGHIHDEYVPAGKTTAESVDDYYFYYTFDSGKLNARLYSFTNTSGDIAAIGDIVNNMNNWVVDFYYMSKEQQYALFLGVREYDTDYEMDWYYPMIGEWSYTNPDVFGYAPFKLSK